MNRIWEPPPRPNTHHPVPPPFLMDVCAHMGPIHFQSNKFTIKVRGEPSHRQNDLSRYVSELNVLATYALIRGSASAGVEFLSVLDMFRGRPRVP